MLPLVSKEKKERRNWHLTRRTNSLFTEGLKLLVLVPPQLVLLVAELSGDCSSLRNSVGMAGWACPPRAPAGCGASSRTAPARCPPRRQGLGRGAGSPTPRRGNAEARGGEVDEGAPAAGAKLTRGCWGPGRSGGGGRRARACGQDRVRSLGGDRGARASGSRTPAAGFWPLGYMGWAEK